MLDLLKKSLNRTVTENGATTLRSSGSDCLNLFATIGALRGQSENMITDRFIRAFAEDPDLAMKILFYARDIRGGLGERSVVNGKYFSRKNGTFFSRNAANYFPEFAAFYFPEFIVTLYMKAPFRSAPVKGLSTA